MLNLGWDAGVCLCRNINTIKRNTFCDLSYKNLKLDCLNYVIIFSLRMAYLASDNNEEFDCGLVPLEGGGK